MNQQDTRQSDHELVTKLHGADVAELIATSYPEAMPLLANGWTVDSALNHVQGVCDQMLCTGDHRETFQCAACGWTTKSIDAIEGHEAAGACYAVGVISLDGFAPVLGQYDPRNRWNGWLCPRIDAWSVQHVLEQIARDEDDTTRTWEWSDAGDLYVTEHSDGAHYRDRYEPDADGLYSLGSHGWVWSADDRHACTRCLRPVAWSEADEGWWCDTAAPREEMLCMAPDGLDDNGDERGHVVQA